MKEYFLKYYKYILSLLILFLISNIILFIYIFNNKCEVPVEKTVTISEDKVEDKYYVDIKGEIVNPGIYEISVNSRLIDVVKLAGGLTKNADTSLLNLSKKIVDEMSIKIYSKTEVKKALDNLKSEPTTIEIIKEVEKECICLDKNDACIKEESSTDTKAKEEKLININIALKEELMNIPGIGESKAKSIIEYRNKNKFIAIEDIKNVSGIGDSVFEKIKGYITI